MSEGEVVSLRRDIEALSRKSDAQHAENQVRSLEYEEKVDALKAKVDESAFLLRMAVGSGQPGEGRLGQLEQTVETLKKFRWQALAIIALILLAVEHSGLLGGRP